MARITPGLDFIGRRFLAPSSLLAVAFCCSRQSCHLSASLCGFCAAVVFLVVNHDLATVWCIERIPKSLRPEKGRIGDYAVQTNSRPSEESSSTKVRSDNTAPHLLSTAASTSDFGDVIASILISQSQPDVIPKLHRSLVIPFLDKWYSAYNHRLFKSSTSNTPFLRLRTPRRQGSDEAIRPSTAAVIIPFPSRSGSPTRADTPPLDTASLERLLRIVLGREYTQISSDSSVLQQSAPDGEFVNWQLIDAFTALHEILQKRSRRGKLWPLDEVLKDQAEEPLRRIRTLLEPIIQNAIRRIGLQEAGPGVGGAEMDGGFAYPVGGRESMVQHLAGVLRDSDVILDLTLYTVLLSNSRT